MSVGLGYWGVVAWSLAAIASFYGYGSALVRVLDPDLRRRAGFGLVAVWGLCIVLAISGVVLFGGWFGPSWSVGIVATGLVLHGVDRCCWKSLPPVSDAALSESRHSRWPRWVKVSVLAIPMLVLATLYLGAVAWPGEVDLSDDMLSYFAYPKLMLQTGSFDDPFAFRRIATFGGQSLVKAITVPFGTESNYHLPDGGIARVLLAGLCWGYLRPMRSRSPALFALVLTGVLLLPIPRQNTSAELIQAVLLFAVPLTFQVTAEERSSRGTRHGIGAVAIVLSGLVIFGASVFRPHIGFAAALILASIVVWGGPVPRASLTVRAFDLARVAVVVVGLLAPWSAMLYRSSGTISFPPLRGHLSAAFAATHTVQGSMLDAFAAGLAQLGHLSVVAILLPTIVLGFAGTRLAAAVSAATLLVTILTAWASGALHWQFFYRYVWPVPFAAALFIGPGVLMHWTQSPKASPRRWVQLAALVAAFGLAAVHLLPAGGRYFIRVASSLRMQMSMPSQGPMPRMRTTYARAQAEIPEGESALAMADAPFLFDQARNRIFTIDAPGAVSPDGAFPYFEGPEAVRRYLRSQGIRFVIFTPPERSIRPFKRDYWEDNPRPEPFYDRVWAPPMLDLMDNVEQLRGSQEVVFEDAQLVVLDLEGRTGEPDIEPRS